MVRHKRDIIDIVFFRIREGFVFNGMSERRKNIVVFFFIFVEPILPTTRIMCRSIIECSDEFELVQIIEVRRMIEIAT